MKHDNAAIISMCIIWLFLGIVIGLSAQTYFIEPRNTRKYQPTAMKCIEYDANDMIIHGRAIKITILDPNQFK